MKELIAWRLIKYGATDRLRIRMTNTNESIDRWTGKIIIHETPKQIIVEMVEIRYVLRQLKCSYCYDNSTSARYELYTSSSISHHYARTPFRNSLSTPSLKSLAVQVL